MTWPLTPVPKPLNLNGLWLPWQNKVSEKVRRDEAASAPGVGVSGRTSSPPTCSHHPHWRSTDNSSSHQPSRVPSWQLPAPTTHHSQGWAIVLANPMEPSQDRSPCWHLNKTRGKPWEELSMWALPTRSWLTKLPIKWKGCCQPIWGHYVATVTRTPMPLGERVHNQIILSGYVFEILTYDNWKQTVFKTNTLKLRKSLDNLPVYSQKGATLIVQLVKNPPAMQEILVRFLGREDPLEKG